MSIAIEQFKVGGLDDNLSYVVVESDTKEACIVDPTGNIELLFSYIEEYQLTVVGVLLTHTHFDHYDKLPEALERYPVPVYVHERGRAKISNAVVESLQDGDIVEVGSAKLHVVYTPGHNEDSVCFVVEASQATEGVPLLISGDTLFVEGCGRTSEAGVEALYESLQRLKALPEEMKVYPGHDYGSMPVSTVGHEPGHNKYFLAKNFEEFKQLRLG